MIFLFPRLDMLVLVPRRVNQLANDFKVIILSLISTTTLRFPEIQLGFKKNQLTSEKSSRVDHLDGSTAPITPLDLNSHLSRSTTPPKKKLQPQIGGRFHFIFQALTQTLATVPLHNYPKPSWSCRSSEVRDTIKAPVVLRANSISFTLWVITNCFWYQYLSFQAPPRNKIKKRVSLAPWFCGTHSSSKIPAARDTPVVL